MRVLINSPQIMYHIAIIQPYEESRFTDIPRWDGGVVNWTEKAALLPIGPSASETETRNHWFPYSQLRKAEDGLSVYVTTWILDEKGIV